jgi:hypothetical protein
VKAFLTTIFVIAIETFQLTNIPAQLSQSESLTIRLFTYVVLGSRFSGWDLLAYGIGIIGIALADRFYWTMYQDQLNEGASFKVKLRLQ